MPHASFAVDLQQHSTHLEPIRWLDTQRLPQHPIRFPQRSAVVAKLLLGWEGVAVVVRLDLGPEGVDGGVGGKC